MNFKQGDMLIVVPNTQAGLEDPESVAKAGRRCRFESYFEGACKMYCWVKFSTKGRSVLFREEDLQKEPK